MDGGSRGRVCKLYFVFCDLAGVDIRGAERGVWITMVVLWIYLSVANVVCVGVLPEEGKNQVGPKKVNAPWSLKPI